jgi:hypothetical protein
MAAKKRATLKIDQEEKSFVTDGVGVVSSLTIPQAPLSKFEKLSISGEAESFVSELLSGPQKQAYVIDRVVRTIDLLKAEVKGLGEAVLEPGVKFARSGTQEAGPARADASRGKLVRMATLHSTMKAAVRETETNENSVTAIALLFKNSEDVIVKELVGIALQCFGVSPPETWIFRDVSMEEFADMVPADRDAPILSLLSRMHWSRAELMNYVMNFQKYDRYNHGFLIPAKQTNEYFLNE